MSATTWTSATLYAAHLQALSGLVAQSGISQAEIARRLDVSANSVTKWLKGRSPLGLERAFEILAATGSPLTAWLKIVGNAVSNEEMEVRWHRPGMRVWMAERAEPSLVEVGGSGQVAGPAEGGDD